MTGVAKQVRALDAACHRLVQSPNDDGLRARLLEALAACKTIPSTTFPAAVQDLVGISRDQADSLCLRILEADGHPSRAVEHELKDMCHTLGSLAAALNGGRRQAAG